MMLALTMEEVQSLGNILTFRLSESRAQTLLHLGRWREGKGKDGKERVQRRKKKKGGGARGGHVRDCSYDVHERGRQWTTGRESLKGTASVGWQDGRRERGKYATAERDKCGRTNRWWLMGSFIHDCDQIQQDSPPYGMAQLIHPITWTAYRTRGGEGVVCLRVCLSACVRWGEGAWRFLEYDSKWREEENKATSRNIINLLKAQHFWTNKEGAQGTGNCILKHARPHDLFVWNYIKKKKTPNQLIEHLCLWLPYDDPVKSFFPWIISHLHQAVVLETQPGLPATWL